MPALMVDSVTIPIRWDGHAENWQDSGEQTRSGAGYLRSNVTATLGRASVQTLETPSMLIAAGEAIEAHLAILGRRTADGSFVGDVPRQVYVRNLGREDDESAQTMRLTFEIHDAVPGLVSAPSGLAAVAVSDSEVGLTWTDNSTTETGFRVERSLDGSSGWVTAVTVGAGVTSASATGLDPDTLYFFRVIATGLTESDPSGVASATTEVAGYLTDFSDTHFRSGKGLRFDAPSSGNPLISYDAAGTPTDVDVVVEFGRTTWTDAGHRMFIYARANASVDTYYADLQGGFIALSKRVGGAFTSLGNTSYNWRNGERHRVRFQVTGTTIRVRVWIAGHAEPGTWDVSVTDSDVTASGWVGIGSRTGISFTEYIAVDTAGGAAPLPEETPGAGQSATGFASDTVGVAPSGWTERYSGGTWAVQDTAPGLMPSGWVKGMSTEHVHALTADAGAAGGWRVDVTKGFGTTWDIWDPYREVGAVADDQGVEVSFAMTNDPSSLQYPVALWLRVSFTYGSTSSRNGYLLVAVSDDTLGNFFALSRQLSGVHTNLDDTAGVLAWVVDTKYRARFEVEGTTLRGRIWEDGDTEPGGWDLETTDANLASGRVALGGRGPAGPTSYFDTIQAYDL